MTLTMNQPMAASTAGTSDKDFFDWVRNALPGLAGLAAPALGVDPRVAGQTVSQVLDLFGIGGAGKDFKAALPKEQALTQLKQVVAPHLGDPGFDKALAVWLQAALEPVQAHKQGKGYQPSVDMSKNWFTEAISDIGDVVSSVDWGQVAQVGMQALPFVLSIL